MRSWVAFRKREDPITTQAAIKAMISSALQSWQNQVVRECTVVMACRLKRCAHLMATTGQ